ncbi:MAG: tripartite tricarboxylate transporter substrate binding protein [bacterium]|nr:tripartite tricarboxylate transporter substrate binding protein [bacterium]
MNLKKCCIRMGQISVAGIFLAGVFLTSAMAAADYPKKPIKVFYGYKAGGTNHTSLQPLAQALEKILGKPVVLIEKAGAGASLAGGAVVKAKPDGYTLGVIKTTTITTAPYELKLPYSPAEDLVHLYAYAGPASGFTVKADAPWQTWQEFIAYAKANPGKVAWTASSNTATEYLVMDYIGKKEGIQWNGVPSEGGSEAMKMVLGGQVAGYAASGSHIAQIKSGAARELLHFGEKSTFEGVPTLKDIGYGELVIKGEPYLFVAPKGLPDEIKAKLVSALEEAAKNPEYLGVIDKINMGTANIFGQELEDLLSNNAKTIKMLLQTTGKVQAE